MCDAEAVALVEEFGDLGWGDSSKI